MNQVCTAGCCGQSMIWSPPQRCLFFVIPDIVGLSLLHNPCTDGVLDVVVKEYVQLVDLQPHTEFSGSCMYDPPVTFSMK